MLNFLAKTLGIKLSKPPLPTPVTGKALWDYAARRGADRSNDDRLDEEFDDRGLAVGDVDVRMNFFTGLNLILPESVDFNSAALALAEALDAAKLPTEPMEVTDKANTAMVILTPAGQEKLTGLKGLGGEDSRPFTVFLALKSLVPPLRFETHSPEATSLALDAARRLGLGVSAASYAHESSVPLRKIIQKAVWWKNRKTGQCCLEITVDTGLLRWLVVYGQTMNVDFPDAKRGPGTVLAISNGRLPRVRVNNRPVRLRRVLLPTEGMLAFMEE